MMRMTLCLLLSALTLSLTSCGRESPIRPLTADSVVLAFGDSITSGAGVEPETAYPAVLAELLGCRVVNAGVSGERSDAGLARLPALLREHTPQWVILCHGGNDMLAKRAESSIASNLEGMILAAKGAGADVLLLGVPRPAIILQAPDFYRELAERHDIPFDTRILPSILRSSSLKSDLLHPNEAGYRKLAESIAQWAPARAG